MARSKARRLAQLLSANNTLSDSEISASEVTGLHDIATTGDYGDLVNVPATFPPHDHTLDSHSNVTITSASASQFLKWDGSSWVNDDIPQINSLDDISDVTITSASTDQFLKWNGSAWVNDDIPQINSVGDISNVTITAAATGDFLRYNGTAWVDSTIQDSDISSSAVTQHLGAYATTSYVDTEVANIVSSAPATLDTLNELAAALGDDPNFATTISNQIGTKLNSSSYTAADVLTKIKTVDGSGSGLDADTLDGIDSSAFLRKNVGYDWTAVGGNALTFLSNDTLETSAGDQASIEIRQDTAGADAFMQFHVHGDYAAYFGLKGDINDFAVGGWSMGNTYHRVWHAGNDGSGSGLDADTVDGLQATSFLRSDTSDSWSGTLTGSGPITTSAAYIETGVGGGGVAMTINDGGGNANLTFNHRSRIPDVNGQAGRIQVNVDATTGEGLMTIQTSSAPVTAGTAVNLTTGLAIAHDYIEVPERIRHQGDTDTYMQFGTNSWSLYVGNSREITVDATGVRLGDTGNGYFQPVSGNYGSIQIDGGAHGNWEGYSIGGRVVFMHDNGSVSGIYNDVNNEWMAIFRHNAEVELYYNGTERFATTSSGANVVGTLSLSGTGRITGVDTVSSGTDAANKNYVDANSGASMASLYTYI